MHLAPRDSARQQRVVVILKDKRLVRVLNLLIYF